MRRAVGRLAENLSADNTALREQLRVQEMEAGRQLQEQQQFFENKMLQQHFSFAQAQSQLQFKLQSLLEQSEQQLAAAQEKLRAERSRHATEVERMQRQRQHQVAAARLEYDEKLLQMQKTMAEQNERNLEKHLNSWRIATQRQQAQEASQREEENLKKEQEVAEPKKEGKKPKKQKADKKQQRSPPSPEPGPSHKKQK